MSRTRVAVSLLTVAVVSALFAAGAPTSSPTATAQAGGGPFVLVRRDAFLHAGPDRAAEKARDPWRRQHQLRLGPYWVMRKVGERDGWVQVASLPSFRAADHCYPTVDALAGLDLRLWVQQSAIAPVTERPVTRRFEDGTSVSLVAGVGLNRRGRRYEASVRGARLTLELDDDSIGGAYRPSDKIRVSRQAIGLLAPGSSVVFGGGTLEAERSTGRPARARSRVTFSVADTRGSGADGPARATLAVETHGGSGNRVRATVRNSCVEVVGVLRDRDVTRERPTRPVGGLGTRSGTSLRPGTALYWPDGSPAGRATDRAALDGSANPNGPRFCFDHPLRAGTGGRRASADDTLTLCVDRTAVQRRRR